MKNTSIMKIIKIGFSVNPLNTVILITLSLLISLVPALEIYFLDELISKVEKLVSYSNIVVLLVCYIVFFYLAHQIIGNIKYLIKMSLNHHLDVSIQSSIMHKIERVRMNQIECGDFPDKLTHGLNNGKAGLLGVYDTILNMCSAIISLVSVCLIHKWFGVGVVIICFLITCWKTLIKKKNVNDNYQFSLSIEENDRYCKELKSILLSRKNASEIAFNDVREKIIILWKSTQKELDKLRVEFNIKKSKREFIIVLLTQIRIALSFVFVLLLYILNKVSVSNTISLIYVIFRVGGFCDSLVNGYGSFLQNIIVFKEINDILESEEEHTIVDIGNNLPPAIELINVSYKYPNRDEYALRNVSFSVKPYEKVALVGKNGSGKSTIIRLIMGYDIPQSGKVLINGLEAHLCSSTIRHSASAMFQDYAKYELSLKDNITISDYTESNNADLIKDTIQWAELEQVINGTNDGIETDVIHGGTFSGGQWQKIVFGRSKFRNGSFIVLDEPNSAIDAEYEAKMYNKFINLFSQTTTIVVSHRLPVCQICDTIIYLDSGYVIEKGNHYDLINNKDSIYGKLFKAQADLYL